MSEAMFFETLVGETLTKFDVDAGNGVIRITTASGRNFSMCHQQDCCESVNIEEVVGDVADLIGSPIVMADESTNEDNPPEHADDFLWTFYKLRTAKGDVTIRWLGESNGYYGVGVDFTEDVP